jgi:hypothetical protein
VLENIWENFFPGCLKKFMQFWKLRLPMKIIKVENKINSGQKVWARWENPDSQSFWASLKFLYCPIISGTFKRLKKRIHYAQTVWQLEKSRRLKTFAWVNFFAAHHSWWFSHERESTLARKIVEPLLNMRT